MYDGLVSNFFQCIDEDNVPEWMTKGRTLLHQLADCGHQIGVNTCEKWNLLKVIKFANSYEILKKFEHF